MSACGSHLGLRLPFQPLKGWKDPAGHTLGASTEVAGPDIISLESSIGLGHGANPSTTLWYRCPVVEAALV